MKAKKEVEREAQHDRNPTGNRSGGVRWCCSDKKQKHSRSKADGGGKHEGVSQEGSRGVVPSVEHVFGSKRVNRREILTQLIHTSTPHGTRPAQQKYFPLTQRRVVRYRHTKPHWTALSDLGCTLASLPHRGRRWLFTFHGDFRRGHTLCATPRVPAYDTFTFDNTNGRIWFPVGEGFGRPITETYSRNSCSEKYGKSIEISHTRGILELVPSCGCMIRDSWQGFHSPKNNVAHTQHYTPPPSRGS